MGLGCRYLYCPEKQGLGMLRWDLNPAATWDAARGFHPVAKLAT